MDDLEARIRELLLRARDLEQEAAGLRRGGSSARLLARDGQNALRVLEAPHLGPWVTMEVNKRTVVTHPLIRCQGCVNLRRPDT